MKYEVTIKGVAERELDKLPAAIHARLSTRILSLEDNPRPRGVKKLSGKEEYRLRVGDYRILFTIDDNKSTVTIFSVGHRREVYR